MAGNLEEHPLIHKARFIECHNPVAVREIRDEIGRLQLDKGHSPPGLIVDYLEPLETMNSYDLDNDVPFTDEAGNQVENDDYNAAYPMP